MRLLRLVATVVTALFCSASLAQVPESASSAAEDASSADLLVPFEATYRVRMSGLGGTMTQTLQRAEGGYRASSLLKPRGVAAMLAGGALEESVLFDVVEHRVRPLHYTVSDTVGRKDESGELTFDWETGVATGRENDTALNYTLDVGAIDRASLQYALMLDLLRGRSAASYTMLDGDRRKSLIIEQAGDAVVEVPHGEYRVREVRHQTRGSSRRTVLFLAPELEFLPVRIEQYKNDKLRVSAQLTNYTLLPD